MCRTFHHLVHQPIYEARQEFVSFKLDSVVFTFVNELRKTLIEVLRSRSRKPWFRWKTCRQQQRTHPNTLYFKFRGPSIHYTFLVSDLQVHFVAIDPHQLVRVNGIGGNVIKIMRIASRSFVKDGEFSLQMSQFFWKFRKKYGAFFLQGSDFLNHFTQLFCGQRLNKAQNLVKSRFPFD